MSGSTRTTPRAAAVGLAAVLMVGAVSGCSGGEGSEPDAAGPERPSSAPAVTTTAAIGSVTGRLGKRARAVVRDDAVAVVDRWFEAAYVGGRYPRADFADVYRGFTGRASRLAAQDASVTSNAGVGERIDTVDVVHRVMKVDVLAVKGRAAAVTVRFLLAMDLTGDDVERRDRVSGQVFLTRSAGGWKVFGFDVDRKRVR